MTDLYQNVETVPVEDVSPYETNPKEHPPEQIKAIADSIRNFGFTVPMVIDADGTIIAGHGRYEAAEELGISEVPAIRRDDMNDEQIRAFRIADNRVTESTWDIELLGEELDDIQFEDVDLGAMGFDADELEFFDSEIGEVANDPREEWEKSDMPEYENEDETPEYTLKIFFQNAEDKLEFGDLVDRKVTKDTNAIWHPKRERADHSNERILNEGNQTND